MKVYTYETKELTPPASVTMLEYNFRPEIHIGMSQGLPKASIRMLEENEKG